MNTKLQHSKEEGYSTTNQAWLLDKNDIHITINDGTAQNHVPRLISDYTDEEYAMGERILKEKRLAFLTPAESRLWSRDELIPCIEHISPLRKLSLLQLFAEKLHAFAYEYGYYPQWIIGIRQHQFDSIQNYLIQHNYFLLPRYSITLLPQPDVGVFGDEDSCIGVHPLGTAGMLYIFVQFLQRIQLNVRYDFISVCPLENPHISLSKADMLGVLYKRNMSLAIAGVKHAHTVDNEQHIQYPTGEIMLNLPLWLAHNTNIAIELITYPLLQQKYVDYKSVYSYRFSIRGMINICKKSMMYNVSDDEYCMIAPDVENVAKILTDSLKNQYNTWEEESVSVHHEVSSVYARSYDLYQRRRKSLMNYG